MAAVASRSHLRPHLVVALLRNSAPTTRTSVLGFLRGLSHEELQCIAEFQGACIIESFVSESLVSPSASYRLLGEFFDPAASERWQNPEERAHKVFIVVEWLDQIGACSCSANSGAGARSRTLNAA